MNEQEAVRFAVQAGETADRVRQQTREERARKMRDLEIPDAVGRTPRRSSVAPRASGELD
jgi:hypothetical protein